MRIMNELVEKDGLLADGMLVIYESIQLGTLPRSWNTRINVVLIC